MKKIQIAALLTLVVLTTQVYALDLGGVLKKKTSGTSTTTSGGNVVNNGDPSQKLLKEFKDFLKSKFNHNTFYDCYQSPYSEILSASEGKYGKSTRKDKFTAQWLFKTSERDGRASCLQIDLVDALGQNSSGAQGVEVRNTTGWCDFLSDRNKLPVQ